MPQKATIALILLLCFGCEDKNDRTKISKEDENLSPNCYERTLCQCNDGTIFEHSKCWEGNEPVPNDLCHVDGDPSAPNFEDDCENACATQTRPDMGNTRLDMGNDATIHCYDCGPCICINGLEFEDGECWSEFDSEPVGLCRPNRDPNLPIFETGPGCIEVCELNGTQASHNKQ